MDASGFLLRLVTTTASAANRASAVSFLVAPLPPPTMAHPAQPLRMTVEEYLAFDAASPQGEKYEFYDGWVVPRHGYDKTGTVAMAGASPAHNRISFNLGAAFAPSVARKGCAPGVGDQRIRARGRAYVYADFVLAFDEPFYSDDNPPVLENPSLVLEILSESTESTDRGRKLTDYTQLESLQEYWIVAQDVAEVTRFSRIAEGWCIESVSGTDAEIRCDVLDTTVSLADLYAGLELEDRPPYLPST